MLSCDSTTRVFTDHRNLLFAFNPVSMEPSLGRHKVLKVVRWALFLSAFTYRIEHVHRDVNTWPDIMTRCMRSYRKNPATRRRRTHSTVQRITCPAGPLLTFEWPSVGPRSARRKKRICTQRRSPPFPMTVERYASRGQPGSQTTASISSFASSPLLMLEMLVTAELIQTWNSSDFQPHRR